MTGSLRRSPWRVALRVSVSISLLAAIFLVVPISKVAAALGSIDLGYAVPALLIGPLMAWLRAAQIRILAVWRGLALTVGQIFRIGYAVQFYGLFVPGMLAGGAIRWYKFTREVGNPAETLAVITSGRLLAMLLGVGIGLVCWLADPVARQFIAFGLGLTGVLLALLGFWLLWWYQHSARKATSRLAPWHLLPAPLRGLVTRALDKAPDLRGIGAERIARVSVFGFGENLLGILTFWLFAEALALDLAMTSIAWIRTYVMLILLLPISFAGFGVREGGLILMLAAYQVSAEAAVAYSLLLFAQRLISALAGGLAESGALFRRSKTRPGAMDAPSPGPRQTVPGDGE